MSAKSLFLVLGLSLAAFGCSRSAPPPAAPAPVATTQINQAEYTPPEQFEMSFEGKAPAKPKAVNDEAPATSLHGNTASPQHQNGLLHTTK